MHTTAVSKALVLVAVGHVGCENPASVKGSGTVIKAEDPLPLLLLLPDPPQDAKASVKTTNNFLILFSVLYFIH